MQTSTSAVKMQFLLYNNTHINREMLKTTNIDGSFFARVEITSAHAKVTGRANHTAGETKWIVRQNRFGRTIVILIGDGGNERLDV